MGFDIKHLELGSLGFDIKHLELGSLGAHLAASESVGLDREQNNTENNGSQENLETATALINSKKNKTNTVAS